MDITMLILVLLGALLASFACAQVWRLRARQLIQDLKDGEPVDKPELNRLKPLIRSQAKDRSECLYCHHKLAWFDLIPILSWLFLRGKCRYCGIRIGYTEIIAELILPIVLVVSYIYWPHFIDGYYGVTGFTLWVVMCTIMAILFIYDAKWFLLPFRLNIVLILVALVFRLVISIDLGYVNVWSLVGAIMLLGGLYLVFAYFGWVGVGDGILGLGLGLMVGSWQLAFLALFIANLLGSFMLVPLSLKKSLHKNAHIPFGPFMIMGSVIGILFGQQLILWIFSFTGNFTNGLML